MSPFDLFLSALLANTIWGGTITGMYDMSNGLCYGPNFIDATRQTCIIGKVVEFDHGKGYAVVEDDIISRQKVGDTFYCSPTFCPGMETKVNE